MRIPRTTPLFALCAGLALLSGCAGADAQPGGSGSGSGPELVAGQGAFERRVLLTGTLEAAQAEELKVPRTESFNLQIRWLIEDGTPVAAGDRVAEFDNSAFAAQIEEKRLAASESESQLARAEAEARRTLAEKQFAVEQKRAELEKARIKADVPEDLLSLREYQERQLALRRAEVELEKAETELAAAREASAADVALQRIALDKARREIRTAEEAIQALTLRAPREGIAFVAVHGWEGRKFREGDTSWPGMTVVQIPDLSSMRVEAALSDVDDGLVAAGMEAVSTLDAFPGERFAGRVVDLSPVAQESARSSLLRFFPVKVALDRVDPERMRPGMSVRVEVFAERREDALLVPRAALDLAGERPKVLLAGGGEAEVRLGPCSASQCVVEAGIEAGARLRRGSG
jgi:HlyD family secretion protein